MLLPMVSNVSRFVLELSMQPGLLGMAHLPTQHIACFVLGPFIAAASFVLWRRDMCNAIEHTSLEEHEDAVQTVHCINVDHVRRCSILTACQLLCRCPHSVHSYRMIQLCRVNAKVACPDYSLLQWYDII